MVSGGGDSGRCDLLPLWPRSFLESLKGLCGTTARTSRSLFRTQRATFLRSVFNVWAGVGEAVTEYRKDPHSIRNWYDKLVDGIGHRKSSFCDVDVMEFTPTRLMIAHNRSASRALVVELKHEHERMLAGQEETLRWLASRSGFTVWLVTQRVDNMVGWNDFALSPSVPSVSITRGQFRDKYHRWWNERITFATNQPVQLDEWPQLVTVGRSPKCIHRPEFIVDGRCWICGNV